MGANCSRWDCANGVEDCAQNTLGKRPYTFFSDCATGHSKGPFNCGDNNSDLAELISSPDFEASIVSEQFAIHRRAPQVQWRQRYSVGRELGAGQTATVFEAYALSPEIEAAPAVASGTYVRRCGRRVALKRFYAPGTSMFAQELNALQVVGVHPNILRLLESFEGGVEDDVLVLEHCEGGDLYDLYAANNGCCMLESFVIQLMRQVLLALQHLVRKGVEHRDVKPENLLLFGTSRNRVQVPQVKLADFGWAVVVPPDSPPPPVPPDGVGSLWYAPPELSPPVEGVEHVSVDKSPLGSCDAWSVGVITYLLLIGHSPFNSALRIADPALRESEVMRLAAFGQINTAARPWPTLSEEARNFICCLMQPVAARRLSAAQACEHPWITRWEQGYAESMGLQVLRTPSRDAEVGSRWQSLDGFQRLAWIAFARAVAEPELVGLAAMQNYVTVYGPQSRTYLEELATELAAVAGPSWFLPDTVWADVQVLAFNYLDIDGDGLLTVKDLVQHQFGDDARESADAWVYRWRPPNGTKDKVAQGLTLADFRAALCALDGGRQGGGSPSSSESVSGVQQVSAAGER